MVVCGCYRCPHNPKVVGSNPTPATMNDEGLADVEAANPFRYPNFTQELKTAQVSSLNSVVALSSQYVIPISRYIVIAAVRCSAGSRLPVRQ